LQSLHELSQIQRLDNHLDVVCERVKKYFVREINNMLKIARDVRHSDQFFVKVKALPLFERFQHIKQVMLADLALVSQAQGAKHYLFVAFGPSIDKILNHLAKVFKIDPIKTLECLEEIQNFFTDGLGVSVL